MTLSLIIGAGWGFLLGWTQIRLNAWLSPWLVIGAAMPLAFAGSMITGLAFNRMTLAWHKAARVLVALLIIALTVPFGLAGGLYENGYNAAQLFNETGATTWDLEWLIAIAGVFAGMWPAWTVPFAQLFSHLALWVLRIPFALLPQRKPAANEAAHAVQPRAMTPPPEPAPAPIQTLPRRTRRSSILHRRRSPQAHAHAASNNNHNGARIVGHVEDRCPYCLDIVKRNDPRGVKVCEVCGTPHHADCWAITGKCQVPHLNT